MSKEENKDTNEEKQKLRLCCLCLGTKSVRD